jgi:amidase
VRAEVAPALARIMGEDGLLVQPAASGPAPPLISAEASKADLRARTLALTAPAGLAGSPVLSLPLAAVDGLPVGLALVGQPGDDEALVILAAQAASPSS